MKSPANIGQRLSAISYSQSKAPARNGSRLLGSDCQENRASDTRIARGTHRLPTNRLAGCARFPTLALAGPGAYK